MVPGAGGTGELGFNGYRVSVGEGENVPELDGGYDCRAM